MTHSDDVGLILPPRIATTQVVIVPIYRKGGEKDAVMAHAEKVAKIVKGLGIRVKVDDRENMKPGAKYFEWERKGVPIRLEVGPKDVQKDATMSVRRDNRAKQPIQLAALEAELPALLDAMQKDLLDRARQMREDRTYDAATLEDLERGLAENPGWYRAGWDGDAATEAAVKERTNATIRVIPLEGSEPGDRKDLISGKPAKYTVIYARAY